MPEAGLSLAEVVARAFGPHTSLHEATPLGGGVSAAVFKATVDTGNGAARTVVIRARGPHWGRDPDWLRVEFALMRAAQSAGIPVPEPIALVEDDDGAPYAFVLGFVEGVPPLDRAFADLVAKPLAAAMVKVHAIPVEQAPGLQRSPADDVFALPDWWRQETAPTAETEAVRAAVAAVPAIPIRERVVLHGDIWPGNVVFRDGELAALLDWEDARLGDPLQDVAITRLDLAWVYGWETTERFTAEYARLSGCDLAALPYWDLFAALRAAPGLGLWAPAYAPLGRPDITEATMQAVLSASIESALKRLPQP